MATIPTALSSGVLEAKNDHSHAVKVAGKQAALAAGTIGAATAGAALSGAGALAGYAGMASAVSTLGLGGVTTAAAGWLGSSATGAAATAVVTAAMGGPVVAGAAIFAGTGLAVYSVCRGVGAIFESIFD